jgi:hypothetical protein
MNIQLASCSSGLKRINQQVEIKGKKLHYISCSVTTQLILTLLRATPLHFPSLPLEL